MEQTGVKRVTYPKAWTLFKQSFSILKGDKELVLFPICAGIFSLIAAGVVFGGYLGVRYGLLNGQNPAWNQYLFIFIYYLLSYYFLIYFNAGLAACVLARFAGHDPTFGYGIKAARSRSKAIFGYALLGATVGVLLHIVAERFKWVGELVADIVGVVWSIATVFIAPVLITTHLSPIDSVKESAKVFRSTWGRTLKGIASFWFISLLGLIVFLIPAMAGFAQGSTAAIAVGITTAAVGFIALSIIVSTCSSIYRTALYYYAATRQAPAGYQAHQFPAPRAEINF